LIVVREPSLEPTSWRARLVTLIRAVVLVSVVLLASGCTDGGAKATGRDDGPASPATGTSAAPGPAGTGAASGYPILSTVYLGCGPTDLPVVVGNATGSFGQPVPDGLRVELRAAGALLGYAPLTTRFMVVPTRVPDPPRALDLTVVRRDGVVLAAQVVAPPPSDGPRCG